MPLIVLAHHDPESRMMLRQVLEQDHYMVMEAGDGASCLLAAIDWSPDIILIDSALEGLDAFTVCARLRATMSTPILMIAEDSLIESAFAVGANDIITWPIRPTVLRYRLRHLLEIAEMLQMQQHYEWYRSVVENSGEGIYRSTPDNKFLFVNQGFVRILGYETVEQVLALNIGRDVYADPTERELMESGFDHSVEFSNYETILKRANGEHFPVMVHSRSILDRYGRVICHEGIVSDISERARAQAAEHEQRTLAEALQDTAQALNSTLETDQVLDRILAGVRRVVPHDLSNIFLIENGVAKSARRLGYIERGLDKLVEEMRLNVRDISTLHYMYTNRRPLIVQDTHSDSKWFTLPEFSWVRSFIGAPIQVGDDVFGFLMLDSATVGAFNNTHAEALAAFADQAGTALRNARLYEAVRSNVEALGTRVMEHTADLESQRAQLQAILDSMGEGVISFTAEPINGENWYFNQAMRQMTGYSGGEEGLEMFRASDEMNDDEFIQIISEMTDSRLTNTSMWKGETRLRRRDGGQLEAGLTVTRVNKPNGEFVGTVTIVRDISQEKALEAKQARFVASASHELRTPLTNLKTRLYLARKQPERMETHLQVIEHVTDQMKELVENLLDLKRFEDGTLELRPVTMEVKRLVQDSLTMYETEAERRDIKLLHEMADNEMVVIADPARLAQVVNNLVSNALRYTEAKGVVTVRVFGSKDENDGRDYAVIQVEDSGMGIAPEHLPHIFKPFYRAKRGADGMGLGLSISHDIVELHGGHLKVESELGRGSRFSVWLALARAGV